MMEVDLFLDETEEFWQKKSRDFNHIMLRHT